MASKKGEVAGTIANVGASLLERADIRSWHLLPQEITLMRVRASAGVHNLQVYANAADQAAMLRAMHRGLFVTELMGQGVNPVTGDYSRGAAGLWIENGELAYPVSEITIASTLQEMLSNLEAIGSDLEFRGALASPTLLISEMTISGQ